MNHPTARAAKSKKSHGRRSGLKPFANGRHWSTREEIVEVLNILFRSGQVVELRIPNHPRSNATTAGYFDDFDELAAAAASYSETAPGIYVTLNEINPALLARKNNRVEEWIKQTTSDGDVIRRRWLPLDFDPKRPSGIPATDAEHETAQHRARECRKWLDGLGLPLPVVGDSGNGAHLLVPIDLPNDDESKRLVERCLQAVNFHFSDEVVEVDTKVYNAARIWKLYGTLNAKGDGAENRPHRKSRIRWVPKRIVPATKEQLEALAALAPAAEATAAEVSSPGTGFNLPEWISRHNLAVAKEGPWSNGYRWILAVCPWDSGHTDRSAYIVQFSNGAIAAGCQHNGCAGKKWQDLRNLVEPGWREPRQPGKGATRRPRGDAERSAGTVKTPGDDDRPEIVITTEEREVNDKAVAALGREPGVFQRGRALVRVTHDASPATKGIRRPITPRIEALPQPSLRETMAAVADWVKPKATKTGVVLEPATPPAPSVAAVYNRGYWPGVRYLEAVVDYPVLKPDGTILLRPGYDADTGLLLEWHGGDLAIPEQPSRQDAEKARDDLLEVVKDFPFEKESHKGAWLAGLETPLARFAYTGPSPLHLVDANTRGSGKGLLMHCIARIITGKDFTIATYTPDENELRKRITSIALEGDRLVLFDNVSGEFGNAVLDAALTATSWRDRYLGFNRMAEAPLFTTWYATGNNVTPGADTARRICHIRLEAPQEHPELRKDFKHPELLEWVGENRRRLLAAALTILRAYCVAGKPDMELPAWGSFEGWSRLVRSAVVWVGLPDPGETRMLFQERADVEADNMAALLKNWHHLDPLGHGLTAAEVIYKLYKQEKPQDRGAIVLEAEHDLCEAIEALIGRPDGRALGNTLRTYRRRIFAGRFIDRAGKRGGVVKWRVYGADEFNSGAGKPPKPPKLPDGESVRGGLGGLGGQFTPKPRRPAAPAADRTKHRQAKKARGPGPN